MPTKRRRMGTNPLTWIVEDGKTDGQSASEHPQPETAAQLEGQAQSQSGPEVPSIPDVLSVNDQPLSRLLADYFLCPRCRTVGRGFDPQGTASSCPGCQEGIAGASFYFKKPVHVIIDLMQDTYQATSLTARGPAPDIPQLDQGRSLALLLFFCQLFEIVQEHVLREIMSASLIPVHVASRLLADNRDPRHRVTRIFPTVTGESWRGAIDDLTIKRRIDYVETVRFLKRAVDTRDAFAVTPDLNAINDEIGKACLLRLHPLLDLFVQLHNRYVPQLLWRRKQPTENS